VNGVRFYGGKNFQVEFLQKNFVPFSGFPVFISA